MDHVTDHVTDLELEQAKREKRLAYSREWRVKNSEKVTAYERARGPSTPRTKAFFERKRQAKITARQQVQLETGVVNEISAQL